MQAPLDPTFLIKLLLTVFLFATFMRLFMYLTRDGDIRRGGISNAFINAVDGDQNASMANIQASGGIDNAFINNENGNQNLQGARVISGESSQAPTLLRILLQFIASLFSGGKYPDNYKGKQI